MTPSRRNPLIRTVVGAPLRFADGCQTDARAHGRRPGRPAGNVALAFGDAPTGPGARVYTGAAWMFHALGVRRLGVLSHNPGKADQLTNLGTAVVEMVDAAVLWSPAYARYLTTKPLPRARTFGPGTNGAARARRAVACVALVDGDARGISARPWWRP